MMLKADYRQDGSWFAALRRWLMIAGPLVLVAGLAIGVRVAFWWLQGRSGAVPPGDSEEYYRAALWIMQGGYDDTGKWLRPPAYPALLALLLALMGGNLVGALLGQAILMGVGALAFVWLAMRLFGNRTTALLSGIIAALFVPLAAFGSVLYAEALFALLVVLALAALDRVLTEGGWRAALLCGALLGLTALTRAVALMFIPLAALLVALFHGYYLARNGSPEDGQPLQKGAPNRFFHRHAILLALVILAGAAILIGPWAARNYAAHQRLILIDTNGGISMWYGVVRSDEEQRQGEALLAAVPNLADRQALAVRWTVEHVISDPAWFFTRTRYKVASLFLLQLRSFAAGDLISISPQGDQVAINAGELSFGLSLASDAGYVAIMLLGIAGLCFAPDYRRVLPTLVWLLFGTLLSAITLGHPRLRLPLVAALIPFAAYALASLPVAWRAGWHGVRDRRTGVALAGGLLFLALIFSTRYITWLRAERYAANARQELAGGRIDSARTLLEQARAADPGNALRPIALADLALDQGDAQAALEWYRQALELEGRSLYAHAMRAQAAIQLGQPELARAEMAAFDAYWRSGNDTYRWAWEHARTPAPPSLVPGDAAALGHFQGFAPATPDLPAGRWTLGEGRLRLQADCTTLALRLKGPPGRIAAVEVIGGPRQDVTFSGTPQELRLSLAELPNCRQHPAIIVRIQSATGLLDLRQAPWYVGAVVLEARVIR